MKSFFHISSKIEQEKKLKNLASAPALIQYDTRIAIGAKQGKRVSFPPLISSFGNMLHIKGVVKCFAILKKYGHDHVCIFLLLQVRRARCASWVRVKYTNSNCFLFCSFFTLSLFYFFSLSFSLWPIEQAHSMVLRGMVCIVGQVELGERTQNCTSGSESNNNNTTKELLMCFGHKEKKNKEENRRLQNFQAGVSRSIILWILWVPLVRYPFYFECLGLPAWIIYDIQNYFWILIPLLSPPSTKRGHDYDGSTKSLIEDNSCSPTFLGGNRAQVGLLAYGTPPVSASGSIPFLVRV